MGPKPSKGSGGGEQLDGRIDDLEQRVTELEQSDDGESGSGEFPRNHVWDTSGRAHGELTGSDDASVVTDAIADRTSGTNIVVPDPGFDLDWDETVQFPTESRFGLYTLGKPAIVPNESFTGDAAIYRPPGPSRHQYIGPLYIRDTNGVLTWAFHLTDLRTSTIDRPSVYNAPGIYIEPVKSWGNNNKILHPDFRTGGDWIDNRNFGTGMRLGSGGANSETVDQNWIYSPYYNAEKDFAENDVGFVDKGKHNQWINARIEFAHTGWEFHGRNYFLSVLNFDRAAHAENTIVEHPPAYGQIYGLQGAHDFQKARIINPNTVICHSARFDGARYERGARDVLVPLDRLNSANRLSDMGLVDGSDGGTVSIMGPWYGHNWLRVSTGSTAGDEGVLYWGDPAQQSLQARRFPKVSLDARNISGANKVVRVGYYGAETSRAELVYDPTDDLGDHGTEDVFFEVETESGLQGRVAMSLSGDSTALALGKMGTETHTQRWYARVGDAVEEIAAGSSVGNGNLRWYVRTTADDGAVFDLFPKGRMAAWTL